MVERGAYIPFVPKVQCLDFNIQFSKGGEVLDTLRARASVRL
jgi:hypothetical protein